MSPPGWYGKLPSLGDFASRRLPPEFLAEWDNWLQRSVAQSREQLGTHWLDTYLTSSIWRFLIGHGTLVSGLWAGILLPSVDRVGRYFPLTICIELGGLKNISAENLGALFASLEAASRTGLDADTSIDQFDQALISIPDHSATNLHNQGAFSVVEALLNQTSFTHFEDQQGTSSLLLDTVQSGLFDAHFVGHSLWTCSSPENALGGFICKGMPSPSVYARMLEYTPGAVV